MVEGDAPVVAELGIGEWTFTDVVAASGGWTTSGDPGQGVIALDVIFIETPHRLQLRCHPFDRDFRLSLDDNAFAFAKVVRAADAQIGLRPLRGG